MASAKSIAVAHGLNDQQSRFVHSILKGEKPARAAELAGYSNPITESWRLMHLHGVLAAVHEGIQRDLTGDAPASLKVLRDIRDDTKANTKVRADISIKLLSLAGHVAPSVREGKAEKPLSEMTRAEMIDYIDRNQAAVEAAERELMARATDVTPARVVPGSVPTGHHDDPKPQSFLD